MDLQQLQDRLEEESFEEPVRRRVEKKVEHKTQLGELIYRYYPKAPQLLYMTVFKYCNALTEKRYAWWTILERTRRILEWGKSKGVHPMAVVTVLNKGIKEI